MYYDYVDIAYMWASGSSIDEIFQYYDIYVGNFIRNMLKINNIAHDVACLLKIYGNNKPLYKFEKIEDMLVKDIVTIESLYLSS